VDKGIVETGIDMGTAEKVISGTDLWAELNIGLFFFDSSLWCHFYSRFLFLKIYQNQTNNLNRLISTMASLLITEFK